MMDVFSLYEEEQVLPKANVLRYAAKVLESAGEPVPFKVPPVCFTHHHVLLIFTLILTFFTAQCSSASVVLGVAILSDCLSVYHMHVCDETKGRTANVLIPYERAITLVF